MTELNADTVASTTEITNTQTTPPAPQNSANPKLPAPQSITREMHCSRFGIIFNNMTITCGSLLLCALLSFVIYPFMLFFVGLIGFLIIGVMIVCTLGLVLLAEEQPVAQAFDIVTKVFDAANMDVVLGFVASLIPYFIYAGIATAILSIVTLSFSNHKGKKGRIVTASIFLGIFVIGLILYYLIILGGANG